MLQVLKITAPIYLVIGLGWLMVRLGLFSRPEMRVMGRFAAQVGVPALLFRALSTRPLREVVNAPYLFAYGLGSVGLLLGVFFTLQRLRGQPQALAAMQALGMSSSNSSYIGYPVAVQLLGPPAAVGLALVMLTENLLTIPLGLTLAERAQPGTRSFSGYARTLRGVALNPMILGILLGFVVSLLALPVPEVVTLAVGLVASAASPLALFVIGGTLVGLKLRGILGGVVLVSFGKLVLHPLAVLAAMLLVPALDPTLHTAAVLYAAVPMLSIYPLLAQRFDLEEPCAAALLATTVASFFTITLWIALLQHFKAGGL